MNYSMESPIKCGVAGVGYLGKHHVFIMHKLVRNWSDALGANDEAAEAVCSEYECVKDFLASMNWGQPVTRLVWFTPTGNGAEVAECLIGHDCHLLVEKPLWPYVGRS